MANDFWRTVRSQFIVDEADPTSSPEGEADAALTNAQALLAELEDGHSLGPEPSTGAPSPTGPTSADDTEIQRDKPFAEIYAEASITTAPYSAEQLLTIIDGLRQMPAEAVRSMIEVMDQADPNWTAEDVLMDVERKSRVLRARIQEMADRASQEHQACQSAVASADTLLAEATTEIRRQITDLEQQLAEFQADGARQKAEAQAALRETQAASAAETQRLSAEIRRLSGVRTYLGVTADTKPE